MRFRIAKTTVLLSMIAWTVLAGSSAPAQAETLCLTELACVNVPSEVGVVVNITIGETLAALVQEEAILPAPAGGIWVGFVTLETTFFRITAVGAGPGLEDQCGYYPAGGLLGSLVTCTPDDLIEPLFFTVMNAGGRSDVSLCLKSARYGVDVKGDGIGTTFVDGVILADC